MPKDSRVLQMVKGRVLPLRPAEPDGVLWLNGGGRPLRILVRGSGQFDAGIYYSLQRVIPVAHVDSVPSD